MQSNRKLQSQKVKSADAIHCVLLSIAARKSREEFEVKGRVIIFLFFYLKYILISLHKNLTFIYSICMIYVVCTLRQRFLNKLRSP